MTSEQNYLAINKESWNKRTDHHITSDFYDVKGFLEGNTSLNEIELNLLGDISGKKILHLQCHFGQDTIALARMGAKVTGVDLSDNAIEKANDLANQANQKVTFVCSDIYDLPNHLEGQFDIVYTSYGTIGWLPDLDKWAKIIARYLKPNGKFVFVEFHPVVWMFDNEFQKIGYNYFNSGAIIETESGTYTDTSADLEQEYVSWNHPISEVVNSLVQNNLFIDSLDEFDYSPYNCFSHTIEVGPKKFRIEHLGNKIPMVYAIQATLKA
jgi:SAM-dependent methyltransferase